MTIKQKRAGAKGQITAKRLDLSLSSPLYAGIQGNQHSLWLYIHEQAGDDRKKLFLRSLFRRRVSLFLSAGGDFFEIVGGFSTFPDRLLLAFFAALEFHH